jgi:hypothetical protein
MKRVREHRRYLHKVVMDDRLSPNRRLLAAVLCQWIDADPDERDTVTKILLGVWANPKQVKWVDEEDDGLPKDPNTLIEAEARKKIASIFENVIGG